MSGGWSRGYSAKAIRQAGLNVTELQNHGLARRSKYHRRRYKVMAPSLGEEHVVELRAMLAAAARLRSPTEGSFNFKGTP